MPRYARAAGAYGGEFVAKQCFTFETGILLNIHVVFKFELSNSHYLCIFSWSMFSSILSSQLALAEEIITKKYFTNQFTK